MHFLHASYDQQTVLVSLMFLAVVSYVMGIFMETFIPRNRYLGWLNPVNYSPFLGFSMDSEHMLTGAI